MELSKGEYASTIVMSTKKYIFDNCMKCHMCEDYHLVNKWTCSTKYAMSLLKEIFDTLKWMEVFSTMDL
jgi:hypothetical protein